MQNNFHREILTKEQEGLLHVVKLFNKNFGLVGGTAIALHIGHRESIDFDLFSFEEFDNVKIRRKIIRAERIPRTIRDETGQYTIEINMVRFTFFHYLFKVNFSENFDDTIKMPDILTLSAMKAYALGRRPKWKDYVDLYFIMKDYHSIKEICKKSDEIFGKEFNEKLLRRQLAYFDDMDYREQVVWKKGFETSDEVIKKALIEFSLS
ncbi:MAG: nucleotidyl transferase AbiEii/AbiGii toxin family protein [Candidatus Staskawiczbacteria bacterium]|nr:nucleotidyl transferase AbiEii/AbiGii toxin family protein [Candidatus Staskawiczbacteria bacterium]